MAKKIWLVGIGMGNRDTLTIGAWNILKNCDCLIGAQRMLDAFPELAVDSQQRLRKRSLPISKNTRSSKRSAWCSPAMWAFTAGEKAAQFVSEHLIEECCGISTVAYPCAKLHTLGGRAPCERARAGLQPGGRGAHP
ncbi:MAG: SAM-dependent methyltransferase [Anaeromassilibacillus sp.]